MAAVTDNRALTPNGEKPSATEVPSRPHTPQPSRDAAPSEAPVTPSKAAAVKKAAAAATPRVKKKVPWKGKSVMVLLPRDDERGQPGRPPIPLSEEEVENIMRTWQERGYNIHGFDLYEPPSEFGHSQDYSQSKGAWPDPEDMAKERQDRNWKVVLPDLDAWKRYVDELNEAKLRALGVSFGDDDPPPPSISPVSTLSRQPSAAPYPPLPFSPPIPTSSASSNHALPGFPFPNQFVTTTSQSPGIPAGASPVPFGVKFNPRASISIPSPHGWSPQLLLHQGHRAGSPSLANLSAIMSPGSPFSDGVPAAPMGHLRHQSLQFPTLPHQFPPPVRASPRLQELREVDEEGLVDNAPPQQHPPGFISHNASESLQKEIDEAEYHLEEQMRSTLDNDKDYSPHNDHPVAPQQHRFTRDADGVVLHHPRPHSRGHSLSQRYFTEDDANKQGPFQPTLQQINAQPAEDDEIETNPSNLGTPVQPLDLSNLMHQRGFSTIASNPWLDSEPSQPAAAAPLPPAPNHDGPSFSKFNVEAPEFKFNPTSTFKPTPFNFTNNSFQPTSFNAGVNPFEPAQSTISSAASSRINVNAPVFSPGQSEFSFSTSGPKFRPDAPSFTPNSYATSVTSPVLSGAESGSKRASSIFGNIDINTADVVKPPKKSKAIPIVPPPKQGSRDKDGERVDADGRLAADESRVKRARAKADDDGDSVPLFAEPSKEKTPVPEPRVEAPVVEDAEPVEEKSFDESHLGLDMTMSSTMVSETTDTKATVSPSVPSPGPGAMNWAPFELKDNLEIQAFNDARPFTDTFKPSHKKSLSATAKEFVPGAAWVGPVEKAAPEADVAVDKPAEKPAEESATVVEETPVLDERVAPAVDTAPTVVEEKASEPESQAPAEEPAPVPAVESPAAPVSKGLSASRFASPSQQPPEPKRSGLAASRFAAPPSPPPAAGDQEPAKQSVSPPEDVSPVSRAEPAVETLAAEPTMDDIDEVMRCLDENPDMGVNRTYDEEPQWHRSPVRQIPFESMAESSPSRLPPPSYERSGAPSPSQAGDYLEDPFIDPPRSGQSVEGAVRRLNENGSLPASDWEGAFSEDEKTKLESRIAFFDGRVNELVGNLLAARLHPLERSLDSIHHTLSGIAKRPTSSRQRSSVSAVGQDSDADDEDDEIPPAMRALSPRRDRKMEQIRAAVLDALATHRRNQSKGESPASTVQQVDHSVVLQALEDMREQLGQSLQPSVRSEDIRSIVEEVVERRVPPPPPTTDKDEKLAELQSRIADLEQRLKVAEENAATEVAARNAAEKRAADIDRELQSAATRIEVEMMNKSAQNQRIADLEDRAHHAERQAEEEVKTRRAAEDRLSEVQRLLRISSEEETRLRELVDEKDKTLREIQAEHAKSTMRLAELEAKDAQAQQARSEVEARISELEAAAREARQEAQRWRMETDRIVAIIHQRDRDLAQARDENAALNKLIDTLGTQLQENERIRDTWRGKFLTMQEEMAQAAKQITEENARHVKKEQALLARQEVLEARLQAEARTRERIETELQRLEMGERQGMRAVAECKRLEGVLTEMRAENHKLHQAALRYQAEFQEARESAAREVQRTRDAMQAEVDSANHQVNVIREQLEDDLARLRSQLDQLRLDADTARARHEMLLEEAQNSKKTELDALVRKHQNEIEDMQARYERQISNITEDAQRSEQNLLERLSISTSKSEYLQDKVAHLEEKLEIAKEAARAAAQAAKSAAAPEVASFNKSAGSSSRELGLPEKISPQALRESIMALQEQLQEREQRIEDLETKLAKADPDAETKIAKRDDEITWLRELLAVRHSDLQDIITALSREDFDRAAVRDAAIRLKANLQMEEQERERAMNGGSAISLPNIAATIRDAATPRVAQAVGPLAAALGSWRRARVASSGTASPAPNATKSSNNNNNGSNSTPSRIRPAAAAASNLLGGLLTPPASSAQSKQQQQQPQPTAFASTGRRFTPQDLANRPRAPSALTSTSKGKAVAATAVLQDALEEPQTPLQQQVPAASMMGRSGPVTPPMMRSSVYDDDAQVEDFDDTGFFEEEEEEL